VSKSKQLCGAREQTIIRLLFAFWAMPRAKMTGRLLLPTFIDPKKFKNPSKLGVSTAIVSGSYPKNTAANDCFCDAGPFLYPN